MRKIILLMSLLVLLLGACSGKTETFKQPKTIGQSCEEFGLVLDNDEDPDWEIDVDGDCEGDIEYEGNEAKTTKKPKNIKTKPVKNNYKKSTVPAAPKNNSVKKSNALKTTPTKKAQTPNQKQIKSPSKTMKKTTSSKRK